MGAAFAASSLVPFSKPSSAKSAKNASSRSFFDFFLPMMLRYCMRIWKVVTNRSVNALLKIASLYRWRWLALLIPPADSTCDMTNEPSTSGNPGAYDLPARLRSSIQEVRSCDDQSTDWRLLDCSTARRLDGSTAIPSLVRLLGRLSGLAARGAESALCRARRVHWPDRG